MRRALAGAGALLHTRPMRCAALLLVLLATGANAGPPPRFVLEPAERAYLDAKGPLRLCVDPAWAPLESVDASGRHVGIGADVMALLSARAGIELRLVPTASWAESMAKARARECDVLPMAAPTPDREAWLDFTDPYMDIPGVIVTRDDVHHVTDLVQVLDEPLGALRGFSSVQTLREQYPSIRLVEVDSYREGFEKVQAGELFGMLGNMAGVGYALQQDGIVDLKIAGWTGNVTQPRIATRSDEPQLGRIFQRLVASLRSEDLQPILNRWLTVRVEPGFDQRWFWRTTVPIFLGLLAAFVWAESLRRLNAKLRLANAKLAESSRRDALTGLGNRMHLDEQLPARLHLCARNGLPLVVAMVDIDHFKHVNDRHGHPVGDGALRAMAAELRAAFRREDDLLVRYGGEEFVVLLTGGSIEEALAQLQAFREHIAGAMLDAAGVPLQLTVSIGVQAVRPTAVDTPEKLLQAADAALYVAKAEGRNRLVRAPRG
jgi:polar amino acid transport system substrate-binding protein